MKRQQRGCQWSRLPWHQIAMEAESTLAQSFAAAAGHTWAGLCESPSCLEISKIRITKGRGTEKTRHRRCPSPPSELVRGRPSFSSFTRAYRPYAGGGGG